MVRTGQQSGTSKLIGFDMGGTSTDVSHFAGEYEREFETHVAGVRLRVPMMNIHTVAAGGGSIIRYDGERLRVGPESAGANPGPACYRRGGPLTVTDANVLLGKLQPDTFPAVFGPNADQPLDRDVVVEKFNALASQTSLSPEKTAEGCIQIAVEQMANAIKKISVARGYDVSDYALQCFGGAGAQHACLVAEALGVKRIFIHPLAGVLSAYGMGLADQGVMREQSINQRLTANTLPEINRQLDALVESAISDLDASLSLSGERHIRRWLHIRYEGSDLSLPIHSGSLAQMEEAFSLSYQHRFAFTQPEKALVVEALSVEVSHEQPMDEVKVTKSSAQSEPISSTQLYTQGQWHSAERYWREDLIPGAEVKGPAILLEETSTTVIEPGWSARMDKNGGLVLYHDQASKRPALSTTQVDPVMLEVFNNQFMAIAEQMGLQLQNTAASINIKERLDFSCALFDQAGQLVANAPHVPVHLGSMGESVTSVMRQFAETMSPGDVYLINDPYHGGTHLPDMTVITPVYISDGDKPDFYVASRGHHADIGGLTPGSMPAMSTHIDEEGIRFTGFQLVAQGEFRELALREALSSGHYPARHPEQNIADLRAQIAANAKGVDAIKQLCNQYSIGVVSAYMGFVRENAESAVKNVIATLESGYFKVKMDNGAEIAVALFIDKEAKQATLDFTGTSKQQAHNFNAPKAVTIAAVLFVFRTLVDDEIPLNAGCLRPINLIIPDGCLLNPHYPAAVVAGNVETSSCVTNALYGVLGIQAAAQPTMNNLTFGDDTHQYYETLAGGSGAGRGFNGTDVVQTLMTNSRLTDPEVLEQRFPVRVCLHKVRKASGGQGQWHGGNGAIRRLLFEKPMTVTLLTNGRLYPAFGLHGGESGQCGQNWLLKANGEKRQLPSSIEVQVEKGDQIEIQTPGGGGFGSKLNQSPT
jgi:5-oxoprolinase (ATP-hydrolysing)